MTHLAEADASQAPRAEARLTYVGHGSVLLEMDGERLLVDPALRRWLGPLRRRGPLPDRQLAAALSLVLITHLHLDHLDLPSLTMIGRGPVILAPAHGVPLLRRRGFTRAAPMAVGATYRRGALSVRAVAAAHSGKRRPGAEEGEAFGYIVHGTQTVYVAGDTGLFEEMAGFGPGLDVACLPIDGWGITLPDDHLDPLRAAKALALLRPRIAVPIHWGTYYPPSLALVRPGRATGPPAAFVRHAAHLAPDVDVRVLQPGEATRFGGLERTARERR